MAVEVILGDSKTAPCLWCAQQFIGLRLGGRGGRQPRHRSTADFLQFPEKPREFTCRELSRGHQDGLEFIPHGSCQHILSRFALESRIQERAIAGPALPLSTLQRRPICCPIVLRLFSTIFCAFVSIACTVRRFQEPVDCRTQATIDRWCNPLVHNPPTNLLVTHVTGILVITVYVRACTSITGTPVTSVTSVNRPIPAKPLAFRVLSCGKPRSSRA